LLTLEGLPLYEVVFQKWRRTWMGTPSLCQHGDSQTASVKLSGLYRKNECSSAGLCSATKRVAIVASQSTQVQCKQLESVRQLPVIWVEKLPAMSRRHITCCQAVVNRSLKQAPCSIVLRLLLWIVHGHRGRSGGGSHQTALTPIVVTTA
jgi:hypothetical protein